MTDSALLSRVKTDMYPFYSLGLFMPLKFDEARFVLMFANGVAIEKHSAFTARMQAWQKMDFPAGVRGGGKGKKAEYGASQIFQLAIMLKLLRLGLTPDRATKIVTSAWPAFRDGIIETLVCHHNGEPHLHYFLVQLDALSEFSDPDAKHMHIFVDTVAEGTMRAALAEPGRDWPQEDKEAWADVSFYIKTRLATSITIEIDSMLMLIWVAMAVRKISPALFAEEFADWEADRRSRGRVQQEDEQAFVKHFSKTSVAGVAGLNGFVSEDEPGFDLVGAAQAALGLLPESSFLEDPHA